MYLFRVFWGVTDITVSLGTLLSPFSAVLYQETLCFNTNNSEIRLFACKIISLYFKEILKKAYVYICIVSRHNFDGIMLSTHQSVNS